MIRDSALITESSELDESGDLNIPSDSEPHLREDLAQTVVSDFQIVPFKVDKISVSPYPSLHSRRNVTDFKQRFLKSQTISTDKSVNSSTLYSP
jgi:hypothetical protein